MTKQCMCKGCKAFDELMPDDVRRQREAEAQGLPFDEYTAEVLDEDSEVTLNVALADWARYGGEVVYVHDDDAYDADGYAVPPLRVPEERGEA